MQARHIIFDTPDEVESSESEDEEQERTSRELKHETYRIP